MTDISATTPITIRHMNLPRPGILLRPIGAKLAAMAGLVGNAFTMGYVAPYARPRRNQQNAADEELGGRDPSW